jgi:HEAT repeat protein
MAQTTSPNAPAPDVAALVAALRSKKDPARADAIHNAPALGTAAITALCPLLADTDNEVFRAGKRALLAIVRNAGRGKSLGKAAQAAETQLLIALENTAHAQARREIIWMLSEIGSNPTVQALTSLLNQSEVQEDARCALERIPGNASLKALRNALKSAPEPFRPALAESLRKRGEQVKAYPSQRLTPTKKTSIKPGEE